jgi:hypothetical protein
MWLDLMSDFEADSTLEEDRKVTSQITVWKSSKPEDEACWFLNECTSRIDRFIHSHLR